MEFDKKTTTIQLLLPSNTETKARNQRKAPYENSTVGEIMHFRNF